MASMRVGSVPTGKPNSCEHCSAPFTGLPFRAYLTSNWDTEVPMYLCESCAKKAFDKHSSITICYPQTLEDNENGVIE